MFATRDPGSMAEKRLMKPKQGDDQNLGAFDEAALASFDEERSRLSIPGAILRLRSPLWGDFTRAFGVQDVTTGQALNADTALRIGSISKTILGTTILRLVDQGKMGLDDDVRSYVDFDLPAGITPRRLLDMTSGLPDYTSEEFVDALSEHPERLWTPSELIELALGKEPSFDPGTSWEYCNSGYIILGAAVEAVTGEKLEHAFSRLVLNPLELNNTALPARTSGPSTLPNPQVRGYHRVAGALVDATDINPSWAWAAGGVVSTADDVSKWVESLVRGDLLSSHSQSERIRMVETGVEGLRYGLGIADFSGMWGHNGGLPGFQSFAGHDPATETTLVVLTTVDDGAADSLASFVRGQLAALSA